MTCRTRPAPISQWTQQGVGAAGDPAAHRTELWSRPARQAAVTNALIGRIEHSYNNAGGLGATEGKGWVAALKRYAMWSDSPGGAGGTTYHQLTPGYPFHSLVDPQLPVQPVILRARDVVQVTRSAGAGFGSVAFTMGSGYVFQDGSLEAYRSVGFHSYGGGTWKSYYSGNLNAAALRAFDTGVSIFNICELMFEVDGARKEVRYYIDGVLVDTYAPAADANALALTRAEAFYWSNRPVGGTTYRFHHGLGLGMSVEIEGVAS